MNDSDLSQFVKEQRFGLIMMDGQTAALLSTGSNEQEQDKNEQELGQQNEATVRAAVHVILHLLMNFNSPDPTSVPSDQLCTMERMDGPLLCIDFYFQGGHGYDEG